MIRTNRGFTLFEIVLVVAIILVLITLSFWVFRHQLAKGRDAKRKDDLEMIKVAFEDYYNDHGCYPDINILNNCGSEALQPYLKRIPCDPLTGEPYKGVGGVRSLGSPCYTWYKVYAYLENEDDPIISKLGLDGGYNINGEPVNYGVSSPNESVANVPSSSSICPSGDPAYPVTCSTFSVDDCNKESANDCCPYRSEGFIYLVCDLNTGNGYCCPSL